jgi:hypothetical protein
MLGHLEYHDKVVQKLAKDQSNKSPNFCCYPLAMMFRVERGLLSMNECIGILPEKKSTKLANTIHGPITTE